VAGSIVNRIHHDPQAERAALVAGLLASPASIEPKYFYDVLGCALFAAICELDEYYPTRTEHAIFVRDREAIANAIGAGVQFIDLGAGDGRKAEQWFEVLKPQRYLAVDIAASTVTATLARLAARYPTLDTLGVLTDFTAGLDLFSDLESGPALFFYPGSSIGNFAPADAVGFLASIRAHCDAHSGSALLIGVDTKKDVRVLNAAYDDALGVTAAFNRNVLRHVNAILGSDFHPDAFAHRAFYNADAGRVELYLEAMARQVVTVGDGNRTFDAGERILTEHSYKYTPDEFRALLRDAGFAAARCWLDDAGAFAVFLARPR
jgi:dimethylhistidine N-methyltransferase